MKIRDQVVLVEVWKDEQGNLAPTSNPDCRMFGYVKTILANNRVLIGPEQTGNEGTASFSTVIGPETKEGDYIAYPCDEVGITFPNALSPDGE